MTFNRNSLFLLLFSVLAISSIQSLYTESVEGQVCEELPTDSWCSEVLNYNRTGLPNFLNHSTADQTLAILDYYGDLWQSNCSLAFAQFLCALHLPLCEEGGQGTPQEADLPPFPPCRALCQLALDDYFCLFDYGLVWLQEFDCGEFPDSSNSEICLQPLDVLDPFAYTECELSSGEASIQGTCLTTGACYASVDEADLLAWGCVAPEEVESVCGEGGTATLCCYQDMCNQLLQPQILDESDSGEDDATQATEVYECRDLDIIPCSDLVSYTHYAVPNFLNLTSEAEIQQLLDDTEQLLNQNCYEHARFALCTVLTPKCDDYSGDRVPPCRDLCQGFDLDCRTIFNQHDIPWPEDLECENFPQSEDPDICVGLSQMYIFSPPPFTFTTSPTKPISSVNPFTTDFSSPVFTTTAVPSASVASSTMDTSVCTPTEAEDLCENGGTCTLQFQEDGTSTLSCTCLDGFSGSFCQFDESKGTVDQNTIAIAVGVSVAILLIIIIIVIILCFYKKRVKNSPYYSTPDNSPMFVNPAYNYENDIAVISSKSLDEGVYMDLDNSRSTVVYTKPSRLVQEVNVDLQPYQEEPAGSVYENNYSLEGEYVEPTTSNMEPTAYQRAIGSTHSKPPHSPPAPPLPPANGTGQPLSPSAENQYQSLDGSQQPANDYATLNDVKVEATELGII